MNMKKHFTWQLILICICTIAAGQEITFRQTNPAGIYKKGKQISIMALTKGMSGDSMVVRITRNNRKELSKLSYTIAGDSVAVFNGSFGEPCTVIIEVTHKKDQFSIGFVVDPAKIKPGGKCPTDFKEYWAGERRQLENLPMDVKQKLQESDVTGTGYICSDIEINCTGPKPARGYFAKPENAKPKSLPAVLLVHAAGVKGSWCRSEPANALNYAKTGALCFDLNAHGMLNGQPESYYDSLEKGELKMYYLQGLTQRDEFYFRGMYLRLMRAVEFLADQPEWDGKRIIVIGESQGGGQALAAAGLDKRVTAAVAIVPAMCDWMGPEAGREGGWPQPMKAEVPKKRISEAIPYFDAANLLRKSKARLFVEIGLIDITCPPASVFAAVNQSRGKKIIKAVPYRAHHKPQNSLTETWEETVYKPREEFISNFLK
jgi:cephalosporin-C deacetylase